ncbi:hypothetical protein [Isoptericola sp. NPDC057191]|uniref:hypothetical protein n=1 Tax=Isoptericola sp. NPDC057191 TaxID=3346041 RepID=UPI003645720E
MVAAAGGVSACSGGDGSVAESPLQASEVQASPTPTSFDQVGPDGLIDGKTLSQLSGEIAYACITERGWAQVQLTDDGEISGLVPEEQQDAYSKDLDACWAEANARYPFPEVTEDSLRERYALEVETRSCLMDEGYTIAEPPSVDVWIDQMNHPDGDVWLPYAELQFSSTFDSTKLPELYEKCPDPAQRIYLP